MCDSSRPANGADSGESRKTWLVHVVDRDEPEARPFWMDMKAYGIHDIRNQLADTNPTWLVLSAGEAE